MLLMSLWTHGSVSDYNQLHRRVLRYEEYGNGNMRREYTLLFFKMVTTQDAICRLSLPTGTAVINARITCGVLLNGGHIS